MRRKLSLHVGINAYDGAPLKGCVNDAADWCRVARQAGYTPTVLLDGFATKAAILDHLTRLVARVGVGDRLLITYSGHGTYVPDRDGDEADGRDEALVPYDYQQGRLITDDELHAVFARKRWGARITLVSDSCHSGTMTRSLVEWGGRFLSPAGLDFVPVNREQAIQLERNPARSVPRAGVVLLSGCRDDQVSYDAFLDGRYRGAMTAAAMRALVPGQSTGAFHKALREILPSAAFDQEPQLVASVAQRRLSLL